MKLLIALVLLFTFPAAAQFAHRSNPDSPKASATTITTAGSGLCPGTGCIILTVGGAEMVDVILASSTFTGTLTFVGSNDAFVATQTLIAYPVVSGAIGQGVTSFACAGTCSGEWLVPVLAKRDFAVFASAWTSGTATARVDADPATIVVLPAPPTNSRVTCRLTTSATTSTAITGCAAPSAGLRYYITDISIYGGVAVGAAAAASIQYGTGGSCGAGTAVVYDCQHGATAGCEAHMSSPIQAALISELCILDATVGTKFVSVTAYTGP